MIKIEIESSQLRAINYQDKKGLPATLRVQEGYLFTNGPDGKPSKYPDKFEFVLARDQAAYPPGIYALSPDAVYVDGSKKLRLSPRLVPVTQGIQQPAARASA